MRDDQYFKPGDKVMRVAGNPNPKYNCPPAVRGSRPIPQYGRVYCVEDFYVGPLFNAVIFVGGGGWGHDPRSPHPVGWPASAFRKVEEIKLCVESSKKAEEPTRKEAPRP